MHDDVSLTLRAVFFQEKLGSSRERREAATARHELRNTAACSSSILGWLTGGWKLSTVWGSEHVLCLSEYFHIVCFPPTDHRTTMRSQHHGTAPAIE